jgi:hypothetical protein
MSFLSLFDNNTSKIEEDIMYKHKEFLHSQMNKRLWICQALFYAVVTIAIVFTGCDSTGVDGMSSQSSTDNKKLNQVPSATDTTSANDGLTIVDISGITATNFVTAGTGTFSKSPETIEIEIPAGATIEQVYLYWARRGSENDPAPSKIQVKETVYTGNIVGGPVDMITSSESRAPVTHRVDLTSEGIITPGMNSFTVQDDPVDPAESLGASVIVFYSFGGEKSDLVLYDGVDFLWADATSPDSDQQEALKTAEPVTFTFDPAGSDRTAELTLFIGDVEEVDAADRPNSLKITVGDEPTIILGSDSGPGAEPIFQAFQGAEWDNFIHSINIPAGVTEVTVEPISGTGDNPASLVWSLAGLSVPVPTQVVGQGCTPGYWKQPHHFDSWTSYEPDDSIEDPFDIPGSLDLVRPEQGKAEELTLLEGLELRGGKVNALIRHATAALLNASNTDVSYDLSESEVISQFNDAVSGGDIEATKNEFESFNEQGCPLN